MALPIRRRRLAGQYPRQSSMRYALSGQYTPPSQSVGQQLRSSQVSGAGLQTPSAKPFEQSYDPNVFQSKTQNRTDFGRGREDDSGLFKNSAGFGGLQGSQQQYGGGGFASGNPVSLGQDALIAQQQLLDRIGGTFGMQLPGEGQMGYLQGQLTNPTGLTPQTIQDLMRSATEREAGLRESQLSGLANRAGATGFGQSASALGVGADIRGQSAGRLTDAEMNIRLQDEMAKRQMQQLALQGMLGYGGMRAGLQGQLLGAQAGIGQPITQGGNATAGIMSQQFPGESNQDYISRIGYDEFNRRRESGQWGNQGFVGGWTLPG